MTKSATLSSNGHEKTTSKYKKLLISKRRVGILNYLNKVKIVRVYNFNIFEIPILTVEIIPKQGEDSESL